MIPKKVLVILIKAALKKFILFSLLIFGSLCTKINAQDSLSVKKDKLAFLEEVQDHKWMIKVPIWVPGFRGSFAYGGIRLYDIRPDYGIIDRLNGELGVTFYLILDVSYAPGNWLINADGFHAGLASSITFENIDRVEFLGNIDGTIARGLVGYKVFETTNKDTFFKFNIYPYVGLRYINLDVYSVKRDVLDIRPDWVDPLVGLRLNLDYKRWFLLVRGDIAGFGLTDHSSSYFGVNANYRFSKLFSLGLGYNFLDIKYKQDFERNFLDLGIRLAGPGLSMEFQF